MCGVDEESVVAFERESLPKDERRASGVEGAPRVSPRLPRRHVPTEPREVPFSFSFSFGFLCVCVS